MGNITSHTESTKVQNPQCITCMTPKMCADIAHASWCRCTPSLSAFAAVQANCIVVCLVLGKAGSATRFRMFRPPQCAHVSRHIFPDAAFSSACSTCRPACT